MRIEILVSATMQRRWHEDLVRRLRERGDAVSVRLVRDAPTKTHRRLEALLRLERLLHRLERGGLDVGRLVDDAGEGERPGIVLDLTASPEDSSWRVLYDGVPGEGGVVDALRAGRMPVVTVVDGSGAVRAQGRPGSEQPGLFAAALADIGAGAATLAIGAVHGVPFSAPAESPARSAPRPLALIAARRIAGAAIRLVYRAAFRTPHWRVGWRRVGARDSLALGAVPAEGWHELPDDGHRFYADPFPFVHDGETHLFVEDYDHATGKAIISAVAWGADGPVGVPEPVLEHEVHLSYPCVLEHAGEIWMIPETSNAATVELYRAVDFPRRWERHAVLIEGVVASDATPFLHGGKWWMTTTVGYGGSLSDSLCLWSAPELWGPWQPHAHNPVLVDIASARPAGHVRVRDGRLLRPVQDCSTGYGAALRVAEITRLDDEGFEQRVVVRHGPGAGWSGTRLHTLNADGGIETIDGSGLAPRFRLRRRKP